MHYLNITARIYNCLTKKGKLFSETVQLFNGNSSEFIQFIWFFYGLIAWLNPEVGAGGVGG